MTSIKIIKRHFPCKRSRSNIADTEAQEHGSVSVVCVCVCVCVCVYCMHIRSQMSPVRFDYTQQWPYIAVTKAPLRCVNQLDDDLRPENEASQDLCCRHFNVISEKNNNGQLMPEFDFTVYMICTWSRVLTEKRGPQVVKKFPEFYGTQIFIATLTSAFQLSLS